MIHPLWSLAAPDPLAASSVARVSACIPVLAFLWLVVGWALGWW